MLRTYDYSKLTVNGMVQYRFGTEGTLTANTGYSELSGPILTGLAPLQGKEMGTTYGQLRLRAGQLFAQGYANWISAGKSFSYATGLPVVQDGVRYGAQIQYHTDSPDARTRFIVGADLDHSIMDTKGTINGRFEENDDITLIGGYAQSTLSFSPIADFMFTLRGDWSNLHEGLQLSPRAAFVYKPFPGQTFRATYNQAFAAPKSTQHFLDIIGQEQALGAKSPARHSRPRRPGASRSKNSDKPMRLASTSPLKGISEEISMLIHYHSYPYTAQRPVAGWWIY